MADPYTIRLFVVNGDPEGVRIIEKMNWTGQGIAFPREEWQTVRDRQEFERPGIYILVGYQSDDDDLMSIYVGEGDGIRSRLDSHAKNKDFWNWAIAFVAKDDDLNKTHIQWLEYALVDRAKALKRCKVENANAPKPPAISPSTQADVEMFYRQLLQILPLVGIRAFEEPKKIAVPPPTPQLVENYDTLVVPATHDGFQKVFLGENSWYAVRLAGGSIPKIKYIAAYQTAPISAITHIAEVESIELYGDAGKYKLNFRAPASPISKVIWNGKKGSQVQSIRYTRRDRLLSAKNVDDLLPWGT